MSEIEIVSTLTLSQTQKSQRELWAEAFELWINSLRSPRTRQTYRESWKLCLAYIDKMPWDITRSDVVKWVDEMRARGLADCTRNLRLAAVSSFYVYVNEEYTVVENGREIPLYPYNPAAGKSLRAKISPYGKAIYLDRDQVKALLGAIDRSDTLGKRNYALFLTYLFTGRRNTEIRLLKWGDLERSGGHVWYRWSGKGKKDQRFEMPAPVWGAIGDYLAASGRVNELKPESYLFSSEESRGATPICMREGGRILIRYARLAGIDPKTMHVHVLRHTAAMLRKEAGLALEEISGFLAHSNLAITQIYLHNVEGQKDDSWRKVEDLLGLGPD